MVKKFNILLLLINHLDSEKINMDTSKCVTMPLKIILHWTTNILYSIQNRNGQVKLFLINILPQAISLNKFPLIDIVWPHLCSLRRVVVQDCSLILSGRELYSFDFPTITAGMPKITPHPQGPTSCVGIVIVSKLATLYIHKTPHHVWASL